MEFVRKHFKLLLIVVCGIALTAEVILLISTSAKKKPSDTPKNDEQKNETITVTPEEHVTPEMPETAASPEK